MNIVLEGPDGSGKSTLAAHLSSSLEIPVQPGSGPPRTPGEIDERIRTYLQKDNYIFDRHPAVSQPIYSQIRQTDNNPPDPELIQAFYNSRPLLIYCRTTDASRHVVKAGEDPAHIRALTEKFSILVHLYDTWALTRAHLIYRIGDSMFRLEQMLRGL